uniref:Uncharacterized protein n=1 Tax=Lygus hesperus TaxID=30085 RepID=A0A0K8SGG7_LYGHE
MRVALIVLIVAVGSEASWVNGFNPLNIIHNKILDALKSIDEAQSRLDGTGQKLIFGLERVKDLLMRLDSFVFGKKQEPQVEANTKQDEVDDSVKPAAEKSAGRHSKRRHRGRGHRDGSMAMVPYSSQQSPTVSFSPGFGPSPFAVPSFNQMYQTNRDVQPLLPFPYAKVPYQSANRFVSSFY